MYVGKLIFLILLIYPFLGCSLFLPPDFCRKTIEVKMKVTAYCSCPKCTGWKRSFRSCFMPVYSSGPLKGKRKKVGITSDGTKAHKGVIAADITLYPYGTKMYIPGYGWGEVHDTGSAIKGNHIDIFFDKHNEAMRWGVKTLKVKVVTDEKSCCLCP